jgi:iron complex outermembrane recepter protein
MASVGRLICVLMLASTSVAASSIAQAQTVEAAPADNAPAAAANAPVSPLGDIIVTARRTAENLQKVPLAVTVLSGDSLRKQAIVAPADLGNKIPSLSVGTSNANRDSANYSIRGQGQAFGGSEPAVITYFAEVPTNVVGPGLLFDLQNVQVL